MDTPDLNLPDAPGPLEDTLLQNIDTMKSGYALLRSIVLGEVAVKEGEDITEETIDLLATLESAHLNALGMAYSQTNALDRLRKGLCELYGLDYESLIARGPIVSRDPGDETDEPYIEPTFLPGDRAEFPENFE